MRCALIALALLAGCKPRTDPPPGPAPTPSATVAVSPADFVSPFACRMTATELRCMATVDTRFRRGQLEDQFIRGYEFAFNQPKGNGKGAVWFGCAGVNTCEGYFMFGSKAVSVVPMEPARYWNGNVGMDDMVPFGSIGIVEVTVENNAFVKLANRWAGSAVQPVLKPGPGVTVACTGDTCTVGMLK